jgi:hypothetical protein
MSCAIADFLHILILLKISATVSGLAMPGEGVPKTSDFGTQCDIPLIPVKVGNAATSDVQIFLSYFACRPKSGSTEHH